MKLRIHGAILGLGLAALTLAAAPPARAELRGTFVRTLQVTGPVELSVETGSGDVVVRSGNSKTVEIRGKIHAGGNLFSNYADADKKAHYFEEHPPIVQNGNSIRVGPLPDEPVSQGVSIDFEMTVPAETSLTTQTGSGDLQIEGIHGPADIHTGSGDMRIRDLGADLHIKTGSGDARIEQVKAGQVEIETGSGDFVLSGLHAALHVRTGSGDVTVEGEPTGGWQFHTGSGDVKLRLPGNLACDVDVHTESGDISTDLPITVQGSMGGHELRGKVRGGGVLLNVRTGSGDVEIK